MTLPKVIRVFFAVNIPPNTKESIGKYIANLKIRSKTSSIRWSRSENLHITLQFLAKVHSEHLPHLIESVRAKIKDVVIKSHLVLGEVQLFPTPFRPRVIVLKLSPQDELMQLSTLIGEGIRAAGYPTEERLFRGHLTLGRIKQPKGMNLSFLSEGEVPSFDEIAVEEVVLFRSEPAQDGSNYTVLERLPVLSL